MYKMITKLFKSNSQFIKTKTAQNKNDIPNAENTQIANNQ